MLGKITRVGMAGADLFEFTVTVDCRPQIPLIRGGDGTEREGPEHDAERQRIRAKAQKLVGLEVYLSPAGPSEPPPSPQAPDPNDSPPDEPKPSDDSVPPPAPPEAEMTESAQAAEKGN